MSNLRHLHVSNKEMLKTVFSADTNPIIIIDESGASYCNTLETKKEVLDAYDQMALRTILFVWEGKKKTDVFELKPKDIEEIILLLND